MPLMAGSESANAININAAAAPIVIFASRVCVPRGPNAVLETELENKAPALEGKARGFGQAFSLRIVALFGAGQKPGAGWGHSACIKG